MTQLERLAMAMVDFDRGSAQRIQHFLKVHHFASLIASGEGVDEATRFVLEVAAWVHDIGIRPALEQFGSDAGALQERLGPPLAAEMLRALDFAPQVIERVCWLVGHHHTYTNIEGMDYRILVEADFLVNLYENHASPEAVASAREKMFATRTGLALLDAQFPG